MAAAKLLVQPFFVHKKIQITYMHAPVRSTYYLSIHAGFQHELRF
jgi:hypothetical protein